MSFIVNFLKEEDVEEVSFFVNFLNEEDMEEVLEEKMCLFCEFS